MSLWRKVKSFNSGRGVVAIIVVICAVIGTIYPIFSGGDVNPNDKKYLESLEQRLDEQNRNEVIKQKYIAMLEKRIDEQHSDKQAELRDLQAKLDNPEQALQQRLQALGSAEQSLRELQSELPAEKFNKALLALANGDTSKADQLFKQVVTDAEKQAAKAAYQRGLIADNEIRYNDANAHFTKAINLDADNATYLNKTAILRNTMGLYQEAEPLYHKALAIFKKELGENHPDTAISYNNLASNLGDQGRYEEAEPLYHKALAIRQQTLGENHADTAQSHNNIANNLGKQGRYEDAERMYHKAIGVMEAASLADHPRTHEMRNSLKVVQGKINR
jgi:pentatricopeptide repeat protein